MTSESLAGILRERAEWQPDVVAHTFPDDADTELTYGQLHVRAAGYAAVLRETCATGDRAILMLPPGPEYVAAFYGCLYAAVVAVPVYPPRGTAFTRNSARLATIVRDAEPAVAIAGGATVSHLTSGDHAGLRWITPAEAAATTGEVFHRPAAEALAFLQYTSGSTATPKGVMVTHGNLVANCRDIETFFGLDESSRAVIWLPPYHDMGLIGGVLQSMYTGYPTTLMTPESFVRHPLRWLRTIAETGATVSGAPNFAYDLCTRRIIADEVAGLDLSRWAVAFTGAEPIRPDVMHRFSSMLASAGFTPEAIHPCYGLAEATLVVTAGRPGMPARGTSRVGCGSVSPAQRLLIVGPEDRVPAAPGDEGEIWIAGPSVAAGYWGRPDETEAVFRAVTAAAEGPFLRTGDLGYVSDDNLFVTGRIKDIVVQHGIKYHPQDIEHAAGSSHSSLNPAAAAAFDIDIDGGERLVVALEVARHGSINLAAAAAAARTAVAEVHGLDAYDIVMVRTGHLPRTSSGKIQRHAARERYRDGSLDRLDAANTNLANPAPGVALTPAETWVRAAVARRLDVRPEDVDIDRGARGVGLDSLALLELQHELERASAVELGSDDMLGSLRALAARLDESTPRSTSPTPGAPWRDQLSAGERGLWLLDRLSSGGSAYHLAAAVRCGDRIDSAALGRAWRRLAERHAALRTTFPERSDGPYRLVSSRVPDAITVHAEAAGSGLDAAMASAAGEPFDLAAGPLTRIQLWPDEAGGTVLLIVLHHIVADYWSVELMMTELLELYRAETGGPEADLPDASDYRDFVAWQVDYLGSDAGRAAADFWRAELGDDLPRLSMPTDRPRPATQTFRGALHPFMISRPTVARLACLASNSGTTLYAVLLAAYQTLLYRWSGESDILIGSPVSGRARRARANTVGYLVNPLPIRSRLTYDQSFRSVIERTETTLTRALAHQDFPFSLIAQALERNRDASRSPVFQTMFILQQPTPGLASAARASIGHPAPAVHLGIGPVEPIPVRQAAAQFDITLAVAEGDDGLYASFTYNSDLYRADTVSRLARSFTELLDLLVDGPDLPIGEHDLIPEDERDRVLRGWNDTGWPVPEATIHGAFQDRVATRPEAVALVWHDLTLSYQNLDLRSDQVAATLRAAGVGAGHLVGVCAARNPDLVAALIGVLKAGAGYVPLDPAYPTERLEMIIADTGLPLILADPAGRDRLPASGPPIRLIADAAAGEARLAPVHVAPGGTAYVLHTSGSTGTPKGVVVTHRNVANFFAGVDERIGCGPDDTLLAVTSAAFDISVLELLWPLTRGARVVIADDRALGRRPAASGRALDFSLFYFASSAHTSAGYQLVLDGARFADRHGFAAVWTPERHFHAFGGLYPNPSVLSAALATITERVHLRAGSVVLPLHDPIRVAEEWSLVDNLSGGRVGVAFASGWHADDFVFYPGRYEVRREYLGQAIETVRELWQGNSIKAIGGSGAEVEIRIHPAPVQPELPVWITAAGTPDTFSRAARMGANVLTHLLGQTVEQVAANIRRYREARAEAGFDPATGVVTLMVHTYLADDEDLVREAVRVPFTEYLRSSIGLIENLVRSLELPLDLATMSKDDLDALLAFAFDRYYEGNALFGTATSVQPTLERLANAGVDEVACLVDFGLPDEQVLAGLEQLVDARDQLRGAASGSVWPLAELIRRHQPTVLQCTPSMMQILAHDRAVLSGLTGLRALLLGGETLPESLAEMIRAELPDTRLYNMYGPTETTIWSSVHAVDAIDGSVPIGRPLVNTQLYAVDTTLRPVPVGVAGELLIGGDGVTNGYRGRPAATAERFVPDPFGTHPGRRLYRTGDLVRWRADGVLEFLGRTDRQVKVNGHRIELGEIEHAIGGVPGVSGSVVVAAPSDLGDVRITAYVVPATGATLTREAIADHLRRVVPAQLVPASVVILDAFPLTANGKIDVRALAAKRPAATARRPAAVPSSALERRIAEVWCEVLGVTEVGVDDNFFAIGGHSLLMVQVHSRIKESVPTDLPLTTLLEHPTVRTLAAYLESGNAQASFQESEDRADRQRNRRRAVRAAGEARA